MTDSGGPATRAHHYGTCWCGHPHSLLQAQELNEPEPGGELAVDIPEPKHADPYPPGGVTAGERARWGGPSPWAGRDSRMPAQQREDAHEIAKGLADRLTSDKAHIDADHQVLRAAAALVEDWQARAARMADTGPLVAADWLAFCAGELADVLNPGAEEPA